MLISGKTTKNCVVLWHKIVIIEKHGRMWYTKLQIKMVAIFDLWLRCLAKWFVVGSTDHMHLTQAKSCIYPITWCAPATIHILESIYILLESLPFIFFFLSILSLKRLLKYRNIILLLSVLMLWFLRRRFKAIDVTAFAQCVNCGQTVW